MKYFIFVWLVVFVFSFNLVGLANDKKECTKFKTSLQKQPTVNYNWGKDEPTTTTTKSKPKKKTPASTKKGFFSWLMELDRKFKENWW